MKKVSKYYLLPFFVALVLNLLPNIFIPTRNTNAVAAPAFFILPHQDDEMFMAGAIREHVLAGREVHVVIVTDGAATNARNKINGRDDAGTPFYEGYFNIPNHHPTYSGRDGSGDSRYRHYPDKEGYHYLSKKDLTAARNKETYNSLTWLGVSGANIHFANQDVSENVLAGENFRTGWAKPKYRDDNTLTEAQVTEIINYYYKRFGAGSYKTLAMGIGAPYSEYFNSDHLDIYNALFKFKGITDKRYYGGSLGARGVVKRYLSSSVLSTKSYALSSYYHWNPASGRFAVGEHSVKNLLDTERTRNYETIMADTTPPATIALVKYFSQDSKAYLSWKNPTNVDFYGVRVVRKLGSAPNSVNDGTTVYWGSRNVFTDSGLTLGKNYYYRIYAFDTVYNYSSGISLNFLAK
jgi:hypothetical protein